MPVQLVCVHALPLAGAIGMHVATGGGPVAWVAHVVVVHAFAAVAVTGVHASMGVGPVVTVWQVVGGGAFGPGAGWTGMQLPGATGVHVPAVHDWSCDVEAA